MDVFWTNYGDIVTAVFALITIFGTIVIVCSNYYTSTKTEKWIATQLKLHDDILSRELEFIQTIQQRHHTYLLDEFRTLQNKVREILKELYTIENDNKMSNLEQKLALKSLRGEQCRISRATQNMGNLTTKSLLALSQNYALEQEVEQLKQENTQLQMTNSLLIGKLDSILNDADSDATK